MNERTTLGQGCCMPCRPQLICMELLIRPTRITHGPIYTASFCRLSSIPVQAALRKINVFFCKSIGFKVRYLKLQQIVSDLEGYENWLMFLRHDLICIFDWIVNEVVSALREVFNFHRFNKLKGK